MIRKSDRENGRDEARQKKKQDRFRRFFVKKEGGLRFDALFRFHYWWLGWRSIVRNIFRVVAAKQGVAIIGSLLLAGYVMAAFYTQSGEFIIRVDHPGEKQLVLDDTPDFPDPRVLLKGTVITQADNISIFDIDPEVEQINGDHNGQDYIAYTFYVKNISQSPVTYNYNLNIRHATKGIEYATWVLLWQNGSQQLYAKPRADGSAEWQEGEFEFPFQEDAKEIQQTETADGDFRLTTKPFKTAKVVDSGYREKLQPQEIDKYTVVIWLEGEDPECINNILGGTIEMMMRFRY